MANVIKHKRGSGSDPVANDLVVGEVAIRTDVGKLFTKMDNGSVAEIAGGGSDIAINTLSSSSGTGGGSATFNGSAYRFTLSQPPSVSAQQLLVSINGVIQKPVAGTGQPSEGFSVDGTDIILGDAPATGSDFFILTFKSLGVSEPADNSVTTAKIVDNNVTEAKLALNSVTNNRVANGAITNAKIGNSAIDTAKLQDDAVTSAKIADGAIVNADINASAAIARTKLANVDLVDDTSPQLGGDLQSNGNDIDFADNDKAFFGTGGDLEIFHDGSNSYIKEVGTGSLLIWSTGSEIKLLGGSGGETLADFNVDGAVELYFDNNKKFETVSSGATVTGSLTVNSSSGTSTLSHNLELSDAGRIKIGTGQDLQIFHGGTDSHIENSTGQLKLASDTLRITNGAVSETQALFTANGSVELYYNDSKKFETSATGIDVTGELKVSVTAQNANDVLTQIESAAVSSGLSKTSLELHKGSGYGAQLSGYIDQGVGSGFILSTLNGGTASEKLRVESSGNVGIGTTSPASTLHVQKSGTDQVLLTLEADLGTTNNRSLQIISPEADNTNDPFRFNTGNSFAFETDGTERIRIDTVGQIIPADSLDVLSTLRTQGQTFVKLTGHNTSNFSVMVFGVNSGGHNTASCAVALGKHDTNNRSLNAAGTVNASGNDYAEYMTKSSDFTLAKGDICGINAEGKLTNKFSKSISFVVKSTDPSYVGGDAWGTEEVLGEKPADDSSDLSAYKEKYEAARKMVDRIAFSGQVPVNVTDATAGQYIIPIAGSEDTITGVAKAEKDLSMSEYMSSVGKVIALESDGRAKIIVKVS